MYDRMREMKDIRASLYGMYSKLYWIKILFNTGNIFFSLWRYLG